MLSVTNLIFVLCTISPIIAQKFCQFNGPQDSPTLKGGNFIQNVGASSNCLKMQWFGANYIVPMTMDSCQWNTPGDTRDQQFLVKNHNGGFLLKPKKDTTLDFCVALDGRNLASVVCQPKTDEQTWVIEKFRRDTYTIVQKSSGYCLQAPRTSGFNVAVTLERCRYGNEYQQWRICTAY